VFTIYSITHRGTQRRYVGATTQDVRMRVNGHRYNARHHRGTSPLYDVMRADGFDAFDVELLESLDVESAADEAERWWIAHFCANDPRFGFNIEAGGRKKIAAPESTKEKMRALWTPERVALHRTHHAGKTLSAEAKAAIGDKARRRAAARREGGFVPVSPAESHRRWRTNNVEERRRIERERARTKRAARRVQK
jgi:group I intron endonuclease